MKEYYERKMSEDPEVRESCYMFIKNYTVFNALQFPKLREQIEKDLAEKYKSEEEKNIAYGRISHQKYAESVLTEYCKNEGIKIDVSYTMMHHFTNRRMIRLCCLRDLNFIQMWSMCILCATK